MTAPRDPDDERPIIEFTPAPGAKIEAIAPAVVRAMERMEMDAEIHFDTFTLEVPLGATAQDIIDTYRRVVVDYLPAVRQPPKPPNRGPKIA